jgi:8-amino-7-oxononanoate synthase
VSSPFAWIDERARLRESAGLTRRLRPRRADEAILDLASNDYLGLSRHPRVVAAAAHAARRWGTGATGSRLVTGSLTLHQQLETSLARFVGVERALVFASGYAANLGVLQALAGPGTLIVCDAYNHASLIDGCRLSRGQVTVTPHRDVDAVRTALRDRRVGRALVVTDSVFSVEGDLALLRELAEACREHGAGLVVDDAHGLGVVGDGGRGAVHAAGLAGAPDVVVTVTLSKSLGAQGGAVLGPGRVLDHLINTARSFIFDTGLAPTSTAAALEALGIIEESPGLAAAARQAAWHLTSRLRAAGLTTSTPQAAVASVRAPGPAAALAWALDCRTQGVHVGCFRPPAVPDDASRLRLTGRADLGMRTLDLAAEVIARTAPSA